MADKSDKTADFVLGSKAADLWLYTSDACASDKVIPKKYRYTTGTSLMNDADSICELIEGANLVDLRETPRERLAMQKQALNRCVKLERKIIRMLESGQYPGVNERKSAAWTKQVLTVRYMCAAWHAKDKERAARTEMDVKRR